MTIQDAALRLALPAYARVNAAAEATADGIADGMGSAIDWLAVGKKGTAAPISGPVPYQGDPPDDAWALFGDLAAELGLDAPAVAWARKQIDAKGYNALAANCGGLRCLVAHAHGQDDRCVSCSDAQGRISFLRCHASDREGMRRLLAVARARTLGGEIAPLCVGCKSRDAEKLTTGIAGAGHVAVGAFVALVAAAGAAMVEAQRVLDRIRQLGIDVVRPGQEPPAGWTIIDGDDLWPVRGAFKDVLGESLGGRVLSFALSRGWRYARKPDEVSGDIVDDLVTAWDICKFCRKVGSTVGGADDMLFQVGDRVVDLTPRIIGAVRAPDGRGLSAREVADAINAAGGASVVLDMTPGESLALDLDSGPALVERDHEHVFDADDLGGGAPILIRKKFDGPVHPLSGQRFDISTDGGETWSEAISGTAEDDSLFPSSDMVAEGAPAGEAGVGGYRSMAVHALAAPDREDPSDPLADLEGNVGGFLEDAADWMASPFTKGNKPTQALEEKVQEVAAAWATIEPKMRADPKLARNLKPLYDHWLDFWKRWKSGDKNVEEGGGSIVEEANVARRSALGIDQVKDKEAIKAVDIQEEKKAEMKQGVEDKAKAAKDAVSSGFKWAAAGAAAVVAAVAAVKAAL